jgi:hypothetical protein
MKTIVFCAYNVFVGNREGKRAFGKLRRRWEYNIRTDVREIGWKKWAGCIWLRIGTSGGLL